MTWYGLGVLRHAISKDYGNQWDVQSEINAKSTIDAEVPVSQSAGRLFLIVHNNELFAFWGGAYNGHKLWYSKYSSTNQWDDPKQINNIAFITNPAIVVSNNMIHIVFESVQDNKYLCYISTKDLQTWTPPLVLQGETSVAPSLAVHDNKLVLMWRGFGDDNGVWYSQSPDNETYWSSQSRIIRAGISTNFGPAIISAQRGLPLVYQGVDPKPILFSVVSSPNIILTDVYKFDKLAQSWMGYLYQTSPTFKNKTLGELVIPGTHNSGCYISRWDLFLLVFLLLICL